MLLPVLVWAGWALNSSALDDDTARGVGLRPVARRIGFAATGVVAAAMVTAQVGAVDFVALVAPQVARRLVRAERPPLLCAALVGALLVVLADLAGRRLFAPTQLPAGVLTAAIGGPYLIFLLVRGRRLRIRLMLSTRELVAGYDDRTVLDGLDLDLPPTPSRSSSDRTPAASPPCCAPWPGCSPPTRGTVLLDGTAIRDLPTREVARRLGVLPQSPLAPEGVTVADLVGAGPPAAPAVVRGSGRRRTTRRVGEAMALADVDRAGRPPGGRRSPAASGSGSGSR